jgi:hypothetical protein
MWSGTAQRERRTSLLVLRGSTGVGLVPPGLVLMRIDVRVLQRMLCLVVVAGEVLLHTAVAVFAGILLTLWGGHVALRSVEDEAVR